MKLINFYSDYIRKTYGKRVQKITVALPFTCPNRDGTIGYNGCTYCNNYSFAPLHVSNLDLKEQIAHGIKVSKKRYPKVDNYIIYFQSYTNTYKNLETLKKYYDEALNYPNVVGLAIATRPDCINESILKLLKDYKTDITLEYGLESIYDDTLKEINRGHDYKTFLNALDLTNKYGLKTCIHIILGLPFDNAHRILKMAKTLSLLKFDYLKIHQLLVLKDTAIADKNCATFTYDAYLKTVALFLSYLNPKIIIQRPYASAPKHLIIAPDWETIRFKDDLIKKLAQNGLYQGKYCVN